MLERRLEVVDGPGWRLLFFYFSFRQPTLNNISFDSERASFHKRCVARSPQTSFMRDLPTDNRLLYQLMYAAVVQVSKLV